MENLIKVRAIMLSHLSDLQSGFLTEADTADRLAFVKHLAFVYENTGVEIDADKAYNEYKRVIEIRARLRVIERENEAYNLASNFGREITGKEKENAALCDENNALRDELRELLRLRK